MVSHILSGVAFKAEVLWLPALLVNAAADPASREVAMIDFIFTDSRLYIRLKMGWHRMVARYRVFLSYVCLPVLPVQIYNKSFPTESSR
jgi:uncharacterized membrane protein